MTYIPVNSPIGFIDNTSTQTLNGTLSRFQSSQNNSSFFSSSVCHVQGNQVCHLLSILQNDSDATQTGTRISLTINGTTQRYGCSLSQKNSLLTGGASFSGIAQGLPFSLAATSNDTGDLLPIGGLNMFLINIL